MSIWTRLADVIARASCSAAAGLGAIVEAVRTAVEGEPALRRKVAFSVAMIALSAKMAKADGVVTPDETRVFHQLFQVPAGEERNVARLYELARGDIAGFEAYAERLAKLCREDEESGGEGNALEDVLEGLFDIARADGLFHDRENTFLRRVAEIFGVSDSRYEAMVARHVEGGAADPWRVLGLERGSPFGEVRRRYRQLVASYHPDRVIARGLPEEFVSIATRRLAAINAAFETIERSLAAA